MTLKHWWICLMYIVHNTVANDIVTQEPKASTSNVFWYFHSLHEKFLHFIQNIKILPNILLIADDISTMLIEIIFLCLHSLHEAMPVVVQQLQLLWSLRIIKLLFEPLFVYHDLQQANHPRRSSRKDQQQSQSKYRGPVKNDYEPETHLPLDKMATISQMIFSYAFSWMKSFVFWCEFHRS